MTPFQMLALIAELLFVVVFLAALREWIRRRDPVSRDVMLTFSSLAGLFVLELWRRLGGGAPPLVSQLFGALFVLQPVFALHLVSLVRHVPRPVMVGAAALAIGTGLPVIVFRGLPVVAALAAFSVFVATETLVAVYLLLEARRRRGPGAARLGLAAFGTGLFAAAILVAIAASAARFAAAAIPVASVIALVAALVYLVAFLPPAPVRRLWQATTTVRYGRDLIDRSGSPVAEIWREFAALAAATSGGAAAIVDAPRASAASLLGSSGLRDGAEAVTIAAPDVDRLFDAAALGPEQPPAAAGPLAERLAALAGARFVSVVPLAPSGGRPAAALVMLSSHRSLFHTSDLELLGSLGAQTAIVAERRAILAEQEALAERLAVSVEALGSASQAKSDFLASMSHELRTPLSAILGFSDLMRTEPRQDDSVLVPLEWVEHIHRGGQHLLSLINDVLDLAKVEAGRLDLRQETIDIGAAMTESANGLRPLAERKRIDLAVSTEPLTVSVDRGRFRQMLYNLLSNAIKYTPEGGSIRLGVNQTGDEVRVSVADTGIGIAAEDQAAVFEEFRQVGDPAERLEGTGLGLALTRRLAEAHGGRIELVSARGEGSRFTICLPLVGSPPEIDADEAPARAIGAAATVEPADVVVIEDDPSAVRLLREYLEPTGYRVHVASDGDAGIAIARRTRPTAIILDVLLPSRDGWEVLRQLKGDDELRDVPVIIVTVIDEREVGLALGAVDYLVKPVERDALVACLARHALAPPPPDTVVRVLAVDDDPAALELIRAALEPEGFEVVVAGGGREALDRVRIEPIDLVVCDLVMPGLDGFEVVSSLKSNPQTSGIPILVCTARDLTEQDKARLNGKILGIVSKGADARDGLRDWLAAAAGRAPALRPGADAP